MEDDRLSCSVLSLSVDGYSKGQRWAVHHLSYSRDSTQKMTNPLQGGARMKSTTLVNPRQELGLTHRISASRSNRRHKKIKLLSSKKNNATAPVVTPQETRLPSAVRGQFDGHSYTHKLHIFLLSSYLTRGYLSEMMCKTIINIAKLGMGDGHFLWQPPRHGPQ